MTRSRSSSSSSRSASKRSRKSQSKQKDRKNSHSRQESNRNDKDDDNTCLYIGNLSKQCGQQEFQKICSEYGPFQYCYIVFEPSSHYDRNRETKVSRGYGFVKFLKPADFAKAQSQMNGREIMGRKISAQVSKRAKPRDSTPGRYLGRKRSPPRRQSHRYRRRSYSRSSSGDRRRRRHEKERKHKDRDHKRRERSRSGEKKHRRRDSRSNSRK